MYPVAIILALGRLDTCGPGTVPPTTGQNCKLGRGFSPLSPMAPVAMRVLDVSNFFSPFEAIFLDLFIANTCIPINNFTMLIQGCFESAIGTKCMPAFTFHWMQYVLNAIINVFWLHVTPIESTFTNHAFCNIVCAKNNRHFKLIAIRSFSILLPFYLFHWSNTIISNYWFMVWIHI